MGKHLQVDLGQIELLLSQQAANVEQMVQTAYSGLRDRCLGTAAKVRTREHQINRSEVSIEEQCLAVLALQQPVAVDLRRVTAALKINNDLERIGDLALNLAERTESLAQYRDVSIPESLAQMVEIALKMLRDAHQAFLNIDAALADDVCLRDDQVDDLNRQVIDDISQLMRKDPSHTSAYLHVFSRVSYRRADWRSRHEHRRRRYLSGPWGNCATPSPVGVIVASPAGQIDPEYAARAECALDAGPCRLDSGPGV